MCGNAPREIMSGTQAIQGKRAIRCRWVSKCRTLILRLDRDNLLGLIVSPNGTRPLWRRGCGVSQVHLYTEQPVCIPWWKRIVLRGGGARTRTTRWRRRCCCTERATRG